MAAPSDSATATRRHDEDPTILQGGSFCTNQVIISARHEPEQTRPPCADSGPRPVQLLGGQLHPPEVREGPLRSPGGGDGVGRGRWGLGWACACGLSRPQGSLWASCCAGAPPRELTTRTQKTKQTVKVIKFRKTRVVPAKKHGRGHPALVCTFCLSPVTGRGASSALWSAPVYVRFFTLKTVKTNKKTLESQRTRGNVTSAAHVSDVGLILTHQGLLQTHKKKYPRQNWMGDWPADFCPPDAWGPA